MKSIVLSSVVTALLVLSGCSTKEPAVDTKEEVVKPVVVEKVKEVETEVVSNEDSMVDSSSNDSTTLSMSDIESQLPTIYFAFDKFDITPDMQERITSAAELGKTGAMDYKVKLEGNCDEWGSDEYNFALGLKRADAVKKAFVAEGIDGSRISMVSYGESNPVCSDKTQSCWSKNRRVDFKLLP
ncbi:OmpA family protein [Sulfurimonas aquatica]|uniref:Peptidoglycan-associated lipoprotein n=1 Tax=Sulfurimonas aquatica TaxID=2672570 RepID=A0A975B106_9BACT|nr:OmpA family protein [Sulfurimonas aquatica]QSZ42251.1 OmpA family protein [Sulfurimonas aquatica]